MQEYRIAKNGKMLRKEVRGRRKHTWKEEIRKYLGKGEVQRKEQVWEIPKDKRMEKVEERGSKLIFIGLTLND